MYLKAVLRFTKVNRSGYDILVKLLQALRSYNYWYSLNICKCYTRISKILELCSQGQFENAYKLH